MMLVMMAVACSEGCGRRMPRLIAEDVCLAARQNSVSAFDPT